MYFEITVVIMVILDRKGSVEMRLSVVCELDLFAAHL